AGLAEFDSEPVEQFGMSWRFALRAEIFGCPDEAGSEKLLPKAIDGNARGERVGRIDKPSRKTEPVAGQGGGHRRQNRRYGGRNFFARLIVLAAVKDLRHGRAAGVLLHDERSRAAAADGAPFGFDRLEFPG